MDCKQARHARALDELTAHKMTGPFWRDQKHIHVLRRFDRFEVNVEAVREDQRFAFFQVRLDLVAVDLPLKLIGDQHHNQVRLLASVCHTRRLETRRFDLGFGGTAGAKSDDDFDA